MEYNQLQEESQSTRKECLETSDLSTKFDGVISIASMVDSGATVEYDKVKIG